MRRRALPALLVVMVVLGVHLALMPYTRGGCDPSIDVRIGSDKNTLAWSAQVGVASYDIAYMRFSGSHFNGDFTAFVEPGACGANTSGCAQASTSYDMSCKGAPLLDGQLDMWLVRGACGICAPWDGGGNQVGSRDSGGATPVPAAICPSCQGCGPDGAPCGTSTECEVQDTCLGGVCHDNGFKPAGTSCTDDGNVCTDDLCDGNGSCAQVNNTVSCDDGNDCTAGDTCTNGVCVGGAPPEEVCNGVDDDCDGATDEGCVGKTTGGGEIDVPGGRANFGFVARRAALGGQPSGQLEYYNHARSLNVHSVSVLTFSVSGNTATFTGDCTKNGLTPCSFAVTVEDNGEPGRNVDMFTIAVSDEPVEGGSAPISRGNVQIHASSLRSPEAALTPDRTALAGAGSGVFPAGTLLGGVLVNRVSFGNGVDIVGTGPADGPLEFTFLGASAQVITVEAMAAQGFLPVCGSAEITGVCSVDMGLGLPPITGVPFALTVHADSQGQGSLLLGIGATTLPTATINQGRMTLPACASEQR
ncbi:MAG TPA: post-COAP-1 domain-containing protein [Candidatus Polarisedimenticolaceae bacterium]|nr:post-COAP-1 domain-containing protein [Candidatus Polarisedimenticolaceae bacterium]